MANSFLYPLSMPYQISNPPFLFSFFPLLSLFLPFLNPIRTLPIPAQLIRILGRVNLEPNLRLARRVRKLIDSQEIARLSRDVEISEADGLTVCAARVTACVGIAEGDGVCDDGLRGTWIKSVGAGDGAGGAGAG